MQFRKYQNDKTFELGWLGFERQRIPTRSNSRRWWRPLPSAALKRPRLGQLMQPDEQPDDASSLGTDDVTAVPTAFTPEILSTLQKA